MARNPKPWKRKGRGWFVTLGGKQISLGNDKKEAYDRFYELMARLPEKPSTEEEDVLVVSLFDDFLEWNRKNRAIATYESYRQKLQSLSDALPDGVTAKSLKPFHVQRWLDGHPNWSSTSANTHVTAVQRAFNWAIKMGLASSNPIAHFEKPPRESRDEVISVDEYKKLMKSIRDKEFRDLLTIHWESGCRPQESLRVEAKYVDLENARWVFPVKKSKGKKKPRIVYLNETALEITKRYMDAASEGPIFRNTVGTPWTKDAIGCRFDRLQKWLGRRFCLYLFRHSFATRMLESGLDALTVALLLGHSNPAMLSTTYQHLSHNPAHMLEQLKRASAS